MKQRNLPSRTGVFFLAYLFTALCHATTYYVSPNGNDANSGTQSNPWKTPQAAVSNAIAGDTVLFTDGIYNITTNVRFAKAGRADAPITFKALNAHQAHIIHPTSSGSDAALTIGVYDGSNGGWQEHQELHIVIEGFEISGGKRHCIQSAGGGYLTIRNNILHDSGNDPIKINSGSDHVLIENNEIYNSGVVDSCPSNPEDCNSDGIDITSSDFVTVRNNHIHDIVSWGIYTKKGSENTIIEKNLIHDTKEGGIGLGESTVTYNSVAKNNVLYNIAMSCLQASGAKDSGFYNNTCYNVSTYGGTNWAGIRIAPAEHTEGARDGDNKYSRNVTVKNNIIVLNNDTGYCFKSTDPALDGATRDDRLAQLHMDYNNCSNLQGTGYYWFFEGKELAGITEWRGYSASYGNEQDTHSTNVSPIFLSTTPGNPNFLHIDEDSSGSLKGEATFDVVQDDYNSLNRISTEPYDLGAFIVGEEILPPVSPTLSITLN